MIFAEPTLSREDHKVLDILEEQRRRLRLATQHNPRRWHGTLRQSTFARLIQGSNAIEGYNATMDEAMAAVEDEPPFDEKTETWRALDGYRTAMTCIMQAAVDPYFEFSRQFLKSLQFMMTEFDLSAHPGQWRPGAVQRRRTRKPAPVVYEAPEVDSGQPFRARAGRLSGQSQEPSVRRRCRRNGASEFDHDSSVQGWKRPDGESAPDIGRWRARGLIHPLFSSIEEWLGRNTQEYYNVLAEVGEGAWNPSNSALPWVKFCLKAHYQQANTLIRRNEEYGAVFDSIERLIEREGLNERMTVPLFNAALGIRVTNSRYQKETGESVHVSGRDLKALADLEILTPIGEKRGRYYRAGQALREARDRARRDRTVQDPYALTAVSSDAGPRLPGL